MKNKEADLQNIRYEYGPTSETLFSQMEERLLKLRQSVLEIEQELRTLSVQLKDTRKTALAERGIYLSDK